MKKEKVVLALGGNALGQSPAEQIQAVRLAAKSIVETIEAVGSLAIVHGNGPQVGQIQLAMAHAQGDGISPEYPLVECVAMSQGYIGYQLQQAIQNEWQAKHKEAAKITSILTQVAVDPKDPAFDHPSKPIGRFYSRAEAEAMARESGQVFKEDAGRGYRRVVASPRPLKIQEGQAIEALLEAGFSVITCGGGGIPVLSEDSALSGVDAVIDKDFAAAKLAADLEADRLIIVTAVDQVAIHYNQPDQKNLAHMSVKEALDYIDQGQFAPGSMLPKIQACLQFIGQNPHRSALITSLEKASEALQGKTGTELHL